ncbi:MAG: TraB/GumN family protein [Niastella sp.]|nr:TraB/GumN family protein [Niastella sp.]
MKRSPFTHFLLLALAMLPLALSAQQPIENKLLWRISGNGLTKPSWLYGTIHLTDKRVFNFSDSLYAALEACEGYAMEVDPDSIMSSVLRDGLENKGLLKKSVSAKDFGRMKKKLQEQLGRNPEIITVNEFRNYYYKITKGSGKEHMQSFMDAWFYDAAKRQGKWVGGIEDVDDQKGLAEEVEPLSEYVEDFINDYKYSKAMLEKMISIYLAEDLGGLEDIAEGVGETFVDKVLLRRNRKMARRIDSLAHIRSTFFAVGSGHLPGDSGVVSYLRRQGFTVQPVISSKRIAASTYQFAVKNIPWVTVTSQNKAFTVQLPGQPQDAGKLTGNMDMKVYVDIGANLVYLAMGVEGTEDLNTDTMIVQMVKNMSKQARVTENRKIEIDGIKGTEMLAKGPDAIYRVRCYVQPPMVYMTMVSSSIDTLVRSASAERFFSSLVMHKKALSNYVPWSVYTSEQHAFSARFPGKPAVKLNEDQVPNAITTLYSSIDLRNNIYLQCMVQDMKKGFYLTGDTNTFNYYRDFIDSNEDMHLLSSRLDTVLHYPAMWLKFSSSQGKTTYYNKVLNLHRGNRIYYLFATFEDSVKNKQAIDNFFSSFQLLPHKESQWKQQPAPDGSFSVWSASPVSRYADPEEPNDKRIIFEIYDSVAPATWYVNKTPYSPNYWTDNDTSLLRRTADGILDDDDSLLSFKWVTNSGYKGAEITIDLGDNHNVRKTRLLIVGDTLFEIYSFGPPEIMSQENTRKLLEEFSVNHQTKSTIFTSKAVALLKDLNSKDSTIFTGAKGLVDRVHFTKADLPLLHKAMVETYLDDSLGYANTNNLLFTTITNLKDETTPEAVKQAWAQLPSDKERLRYNMLGMLASHATTSSYQLAKELLLQHTPQAENAWAFFGLLSDTLQLTATILPELLPLLSDTLAGPNMISLVEQLLDSNLIESKVVLEHKERLFKMAGTALNNTNEEENFSWYYNYHSLIRVLAKMKDPAANQWVRKFLSQANLDVKYTAALALLKVGQPVPAVELLKLAADKGQRFYLYNELKKINKLALFPKQHLTQQALAESELYASASEENEVKKMTFIGERTAMYKGVRKKFYLYKIDMSYEDEKIINLGIAGPYPLKPAGVMTGAGAIGINWDKDYNAATIDADLKAYLKEVEQYDKEP